MKTFNEHLKHIAELNKIKNFLKINNISEEQFVKEALENAFYTNDIKIEEIQNLLNEGVGNWFGSMLPGRWGAGFEQSNQADKMIAALQQYAKAGLPANDRRVVSLYNKMGISDPSKAPAAQELVTNKQMQQEFRNKAYGAGYGDYMAGLSGGSLASAPQTPSGLGKIDLSQSQGANQNSGERDSRLINRIWNKLSPAMQQAFTMAANRLNTNYQQYKQTIQKNAQPQPQTTQPQGWTNPY